MNNTQNVTLQFAVVKLRNSGRKKSRFIANYVQIDGAAFDTSKRNGEKDVIRTHEKLTGCQRNQWSILRRSVYQ